MTDTANVIFVPGVVLPTVYAWGKGYVIRNDDPAGEALAVGSVEDLAEAFVDHKSEPAPVQK